MKIPFLTPRSVVLQAPAHATSGSGFSGLPSPRTSPFDRARCPRAPLGLALLVAVGWALAAATPVWAYKFPDKNLEAAVRAQVFAKRNNQEELTEEDLKNVFILKGDGKEIADLTGLEKCPNLALISLSDNAIADVKPLAGLENLQSLDLSKNKIKDIAPLEKLTKLQYLELSDNEIENVAAIADMKNMMALYLSGNKIKDVKPLADLPKLASLYLSNNEVKDLAPLKDLKRLEVVGLKHNGLSDLAPLAGWTDLRMLFLEGNDIKNLKTLVEMAKKDSEGEQRFAPFLRLYLAENPLGPEADAQLAELKKYGVRIESR